MRLVYKLYNQVQDNFQISRVLLASFLLTLAAHASAEIVLSEIMYYPIGGNTNEFVELHNTGTSAVDVGGWFFSNGITYTFPTSSVLAPGAYLVVAVNRSAFALLYPDVTTLAEGVYLGQLSNQGETLSLSDNAGTVVFSVTYNNKEPWPLAAAGLGNSLVLIDPDAPEDTPDNWAASAQLNGSPGGPDRFFMQDVVINEVLAHTDPPYEDAVELRNLTTNTISMAGWYLSDDNTTRKKFRFPPGTEIPPLGYLTVYQYQMLSALIPFSLSAKGDELYLSEADSADTLVRYVDQYQYEASQNGVAFGRYPDGTGVFTTLAMPTFGVSSPQSIEEFRTGAGARNAAPQIGPVVINEIMYHPSDSNDLGRMSVEYIELLNISGSPVPLYHAESAASTWSLTSGISYSFPTNLTLQPGQLLVVVATNDVEGFRQSYGLSADAVILGPWSKALNNAGDTIRLRAPDNIDPIDGTLARYVVDEVTYSDRLPWPLAADGLGGSLERTDPLAFGNTAANWHSVPGIATPCASNTLFIPPGAVIISEIMAVNRSTLRDDDGDFSDWIELFNTTGHAVSLKGWHLTDQPDKPALWTFPDISIPAHGQIVVFASQKNRADPLAPLHTSFALGAAGEYLALFRNDLVLEYAFDPIYPPQSADVSYGLNAAGTRTETPIQAGAAGRYMVPATAADLAANWSVPAFDDSAWKPAGNGIGYDTDNDYRPLFQTDLYAEMFGLQGSAFVRYPFVLNDSAAIEQMWLRLKFEDGFAAWVNGVIVASNNVPTALSWNSRSSSSRSDSLAVVFKEFNLNGFAHLLVDGTNVLAMQVLNTSSTSSDLLLMSDLKLIWTPATTAVSKITGYLYPATPGSSNAMALPGVTPAPRLSVPGGVFSGTLSVTVTCANAQALIRYTLDGSEPTVTSPLYSFPLVITAETELLTRAFAPGLVPSPITGAAYRRTFLGINEILASNVTATPEIADFTDFGDWIELYNGGASPVDLSGYHLSDNLDQPFRWCIPSGTTIPAGGHLIFWADGYDSQPGLTLTRDFWPNTAFVTRSYHTSFKLSADGEAVGLFSPGGSRIDAVTFGRQQGDLSYGRYPDGGATWGYFGEPTAARPNRMPQLVQNLHRSPAVTVSPAEPLFVTGPVTVTLSSAPGVAAIRYTLDSSQPHTDSLLYSNAFTVATTTVVRARAFADALHPGPVVTRTFLVDQRKPDLPVMSVVVDPLLFYDNVTGIFKNSLKEREIPAAFQFCTTPTSTAFQFDAGLRIFSYNTFLNAQKPFTIYLDGKYGTDELAYQLFPEKPIGVFDRFVLRNGNDDWNDAYFRDGLCVKIMEGRIVNALQGYQPTASYLNGSYYGLINIREKLDEMFVVKNEGFPLENVDFYEMDGVDANADPLLNSGTDAGWLALTGFLATHNLSLQANYDYVRSQVDIENLMDYVIANSFVNDTAWAHNRKWWRDRSPNGRWRWGFLDLDRALLGGRENDNRIADMAVNLPVFRELLNNPTFRETFAQRYAAHLSSTFSPDRVIPIIDREAARLRNEMPYYIARYAAQGGIASMTAWEAELEEIRTFVRRRPAVALRQLAELLGSGTTAQINVQTANDGGQVLANCVPLQTASTSALLAGVPVQFTARPAIGQSFAYWVVSSHEILTKIASGSVWRYFDIGTEPAAAGALSWRDIDYPDADWPAGPAILGFAGGGTPNSVATVTRRYVTGTSGTQVTTTYLRRTFMLDSTAGLDDLTIDILRDDGAVVYLNGTELLRENMPSGTPAYSTRAAATIGSPEQNTAFTRYVSAASLLRSGTNVVAVELHQGSTTSSDLYFDLQASFNSASGSSHTNFSPLLEITPSSLSRLTVQAVFVPTGASMLPAVVAGSLTLTAAGSPYLATGDIYVPSNTCLSAEPGVSIRMPSTASIYVQGELRLEGSVEAPVRIELNTDLNAIAQIYSHPELNTAPGQIRWGGIAFNYADHTGILSNVVIRGASLAAADVVNFKGAVNALGSDLYMDGLDMDDVHFPIFVQEGNSTVLCNSRLHINVSGDIINIKRATYARVENNDLRGCDQPDTDAVDYDGVHIGIIRNNHIYDFIGFNSDGVDIGEEAKEILLEGNLIENCSDKGISIGQHSTIIARHNLIRNVAMGIGIKDTGSRGLIENNTFYNLSHAVSVYEKNPGAGGGAATVRNCIISQAHISPFVCDALSTLEVSYTLSDTDAVAGTGNVTDDPLFLNAATGNFGLQTGSPAVDSGVPDADLDADGSRADMGAFAFDWRAGHAVITEIHYHPVVVGQAEYIELTNPGGAPLDLAGYSFSKGITYTFPEGTVLNPGDYLVIASSPYTPYDAPALVWSAGTLDNAGETLQLIDAVSNVIDRVAYKPVAPWPTEPDGQNLSLSLIHPRWNNALPTSWYASTAPGGTPGSPFDNAAAMPSHRIIVSVIGYGTVTPSGEHIAATYSAPGFTITPGEWCALSDVLIDGTSVGPQMSYTFTNLLSDHTLHAVFDAELAAHDTPKWWLAQGGVTTDFDAAATNDWDQDGMANWAEYIAGTQPTNASSVLTVDITSENGTLLVCCPTLAAGPEYGGRRRYYSLEGRTNLVTGMWMEIPGYNDLPGTGQTITHTNPPQGTLFIRAKATLR